MGTDEVGFGLLLEEGVGGGTGFYPKLALPLELVLELDGGEVVGEFVGGLEHVVLVLFAQAHGVAEFFGGEDALVDEGEAVLEEGLEDGLDFVLGGGHC